MKQLLVGSDDIAEVFSVEPRRVQQLTKEGVISATRDGNAYKYDLIPTIKTYIKYLSDKANGREKPKKGESAEMRRLEAEADLKRSKADKAALELQELEGNMHNSEDVEALFSGFTSDVKSQLLALPSRCAKDAHEAKTTAETAEVIKKEVYIILNNLSEHKYDPDKFAERVRERNGWRDKVEADAENGEEES